MDKAIQYAVVVFLLSIVNTALAGETVNLPSDNSQWTPMPQMEIGKVKRLSKDQLSPDLKAFAEKQMAESQRGYETVPEEFFVYSSNYRNHLRLEDEVKPKLHVKLADINSTELKEYVYEGIIPEGPSIDGPWTSATRVFKRPDGVTLMLTEWDYIADGGAIVGISELMNVTVANVPAALSVKKSPSGKTMTMLEYPTDKKSFTITVWDDVDMKHKGKEYDRKWLLNLANSIVAQ